MYSSELLLKLESSIIEDVTLQFTGLCTALELLFNKNKSNNNNRNYHPRILRTNAVLSGVPGTGSLMAEEHTLQKDPHGYSKWTNEEQMIVVSVFTALGSQICIAMTVPLHYHHSISEHSHKQRQLGSQ